MEIKKEERESIDLNAPAFGADTQPEKEPVDEPKEIVTAEESQPKSEESKEEEEQRIPYSRFAATLKKARDAERAAREAQERLEELESRRSYREEKPIEFEDEIRKTADIYFGENEKAKEQYVRIELEKARKMEEIAERRALDALQRRESTSRSELETNERVIDDQIEDLSLSLGRDLTQAEEEAVLTIADEYSPVDEDGRYISGQPLPLNKAWEIYELRLDRQAATSKKARRQATAATSIRTEAETPNREEDDKNYRPSWGNWRKRFNS